MALECIYSADGIDTADFEHCFVKFLETHYKRDVEEVALSSHEQNHFGIKVCAKLLIEHDQKIGSLLLFKEEHLLPLFADSVVKVQKNIIAEMKRKFAETGDPQAEDFLESATVKGNVHVRLHNLPPGFVKRNVSMISSQDCGNFIEVTGTVIRTGMIKMLEMQKDYVCCSSRCNHRFRVRADLSQDGAMEMPKRCPSSGRCRSTNFEFIEGSRICCDYQEVRIQEQMQSLSVGMIPRQILVVLTNDIVDVCKAGDDVMISGRLKQRWLPLKEGARCDIELFLLANNISVRNDSSGIRFITDDLKDEFEQFWADARRLQKCYTARNFILSSVCPQIYGSLGSVEPRNITIIVTCCLFIQAFS